MTALMGTLMALAGCTATTPATCAEEDFDAPPALSCDAAIAAAREQLTSVAGVTELRFAHDECPPSGRCPFIPGEVGRVTATLAGGEELEVFVQLGPEGVVHATGPADVPEG